MDDFRNITEFVDSLPSRGFPGMDVTVARDHKILYRHSAGYTDMEAGVPVSGNELYYMYSCTKVVTCAAALRLMERGGFIMSDPVSDYLPEFAGVRVRSASGAYSEPAKSPILMRHLFNMTSGYAYDLTNPCIQEVQARTGGRCPTRETVAAMARMSIDFEPGTHFRYGLSHDILAAVVEVISGERFSDFVKKNILDPCGMTESGFRMTDAVRARMAKLYSYNVKTGHAVPATGGNVYILGTDYDSGGAGLISSVSDYIKFADALASGGVAATGTHSFLPFDRPHAPQLSHALSARRIRGSLARAYRLRLRLRCADVSRRRGRFALPGRSVRLAGCGGFLCHYRPFDPHLALLCHAHASQSGKLRLPPPLQFLF